MATILLVGNITRGVIYWRLAPPPAVVEPVAEVMPWEPVEVAPDGTLQAMIDFADADERWWESEPSEYEDDMIDRLFWSRGAW